MSDTQNNTEHFPLDYDSLEKGDIIAIDRVQHIVGKEPGTTEYSLAVMKLCGTIMDEMAARETPVCAVTKANAIHILTDPEASAYCARRAEVHYSGMVRTHGRMRNVDIANLDDTQRYDHERRVLLSAHMVRGARAGRREAFRLIPHARTTPVRELEDVQDAGEEETQGA